MNKPVFWIKHYAPAPHVKGLYLVKGAINPITDDPATIDEFDTLKEAEALLTELRGTERSGTIKFVDKSYFKDAEI